MLKPKLSRTSFQCLSESASVSPRNASAAIADGTLAAPDEPIAGRDGRVCLTNNAARRALRGIALGCRNWPAPVPSAGPIVPPSCHPHHAAVSTTSMPKHGLSAHASMRLSAKSSPMCSPVSPIFPLPACTNYRLGNGRHAERRLSRRQCKQRPEQCFRTLQAFVGQDQ